jgi:hypothetical protein
VAADQRITRRSWRLVVLSLASLAVCGEAVAAYGFTVLHWGCESYAEANAPLSPEKVTRAFRERGIVLTLQPPQPGGEYTKNYRHSDRLTTLSVTVCTKPCILDPPPPRLLRRRFVRRIIEFRNVYMAVSGRDAGEARELLRKLTPIVSELTPSSHDGRCFPR